MSKIQQELTKKSSKAKAKILQRFFKTGPGEYGEGDIFIGVKVPEIRAIVKKFKSLKLTETTKLLKSKIHEERLTSLLILVAQYSKADDSLKEKIYSIYLKNTKY